MAASLLSTTYTTGASPVLVIITVAVAVLVVVVVGLVVRWAFRRRGA